jgi:hypothetical protein
MFEEREVQPSSLLNALTNLDFDEGMRIHDSSGCITFVTRSVSEFCLNICKDSDEKWFYVHTAEEAFEMLKRQLKEPFKIWLY